MRIVFVTKLLFSCIVITTSIKPHKIVSSSYPLSITHRVNISKWKSDQTFWVHCNILSVAHAFWQVEVQVFGFKSAYNFIQQLDYISILVLFRVNNHAGDSCLLSQQASFSCKGNFGE